MNKYTREITQTINGEDRGLRLLVDVYDVLRAFAVTDPAIQHAVKKLLCTGIRGHKDSRQDLEEAIQSIERALDVIKAEEVFNEPLPVERKVAPNSLSAEAHPFAIGDIIHHREDSRGCSGIKWEVTGFTGSSVQVVSADAYRSPSWIPEQDWYRYAKAEQVAQEEPQPCHFAIGDVIQHIDPEYPKTKWKITHIKSNMLLVTSYDPYQTPSYIEEPFWANYRVIQQTGIDKPATTC